MKKAFDQTLRDLKREVNKKVLKVPSVEQKVLDATSNEPWGPHGSLLADIAQASRNYHEYQMIMTIIWKRINSTGKNWRHVYKGLTVLEYLVANGSERAIDEIKEHAYQISTLSSFQYIDSSGRDQGLNVRRKSQSLVSLVNDKEKIQEVREKAAANRDKFRSESMGGAHGPGSYSGGGYGDRYDDERYGGRYGSRDGDRNGYGREGEWSNRDDDRYGRYGDSYSRDGDRNGRDSEERYGRGNYRDDDHRGRYADESGSRSSERDRDRAYDDEHYSSRGSSVKAEDHPQEGRPLERKFSEQNIGAPPSYEEVVGGSKSPVYSERNGEPPAAPIPKPTSPTVNTTPGQTTPDMSSSWSDPNNKAESEVVDEFDPRSSKPAAVSGTSNNAEGDLIGSLSESWAITPVSSVMSSTDANASGTFAESQYMTSSSSPATVNQSFEDPFGDSPFKAFSSPADVTSQAQNFAHVSSFQPSAVNFVEQSQQTQQVAQITNNFGTSDASSFQLPPNSQPMQQEPLSFSNNDILAGILPPSGPPPPAASQTPFMPTAYQPTVPAYNGQNFVQQSGPPPAMMPTSQNSGMNFLPQSTPAPSNTAPQFPAGNVPQQTNNLMGGLLSQAGPLALVSQPAPKQKFELKSAVWADTLSRGLVDLNISGAKVNPNAGIGVDFDSLNRKEKRMEKPTAASVTSTVNMGKAMGSGSGMGRSGASMIKPQSNPMMGSGTGMGMGIGGAPGVGMVMGGYGMMNQQPNMGMGMRGNMGMGMGQGVPMQQANGMHPGANMSVGYNPMMGRGGYPQQPYGSGYQ